ncbi:hypothetical protein FGU65_01685 [Methanoculleus sp. FWC-SCC1]|uniref:Uncharacterized protein n=1 Tax=Methanoculleus frigidifontis TaxID=2584085 RepID=A0ABT8M6Q8_9EURY|nr:hypothetical protein [Methanoculleus sp. FWC-SCC1]MDN7023621.1 hypothetical protein [Methanoculleus sp. FWC-SCC1]
MTVPEFIPVSQETYNEIAELKGPERTFDEFLADLVERAKKQQLERDTEAVLTRNRFGEV